MTKNVQNRFPTHPERNEIWCCIIRKQRKDPDFIPFTNARICSDHFNKEDISISRAGLRRLKETAIPQIGIEVDEERRPSVLEQRPRNKKMDVIKKKGVHFKKCRSIIAKKIKKGSKQNIRVKKQNKSLIEIIKIIKNKKYIDDEMESVLNKYAELAEPYRIQTIKNKFNSSLQMEIKKEYLLKFYPPALRKFALALNFYSLSAYKYVREKFECCLPHETSLLKWYRSSEGEPGFTGASFDALENQRETLGKNIECCLLLDELNIRQTRLCRGLKGMSYVDMGHGLVDRKKKATKAFMMMLVCLDKDWKMPVGYFLVDSFSSELIANTINICLVKCDFIGVNVRAVTFTGSARNIEAANILGCNISNTGQLKTTFPHPVTKVNVAVFMDPCHMIKLVRNALEKRKIFFNGKDQRIEGKFFNQLLKLQKNQRLNFDKKITNRYIHFKNQILKIKLGTQLLSRNVAKALTLCNELLDSKCFVETQPTIEFITILNNIFDILNSRKLNHTGYKKAIWPNNKRRIFNFIERAIAYIRGLKINIKYKRYLKKINRQPRLVMMNNKKLILESSCKIGFMGLIVCLESLKILYESLVKSDSILKHISTYRLSLFHLEQFFKVIKQLAGFDVDPDAAQLRVAYEHYVNHIPKDKSKPLNENGIAFDHCQVLDVSSVKVINNTSEMNRHEVKDDSETTKYTLYSVEKDDMYTNNCAQLSITLNNQTENAFLLLSENTELIVGYIAGSIAWTFIKKLKCEICVSSLVSDEKLFFHKLIEFNSMEALCFPSPDLFQVCLETEKIIKNHNGPVFMTRRDFMYLSIKALKKFVGKSTFSVLNLHCLEQPATLNHRLHLIRAIINKYINIRMNDECYTDYMEREKIVLFKEQLTTRRNTESYSTEY